MLRQCSRRERGPIHQEDRRLRWAAVPHRDRRVHLRRGAHLQGAEPAELPGRRSLANHHVGHRRSSCCSPSSGWSASPFSCFRCLKRHGESLALAHVGFRVTELAASLFYLAVPLLAIELGAGLSDGTVDGSASSSLGALLQAQHHVAILMIYIATGAAGICMATLLYRSRLIPRWLAILGLVTYPTFWWASSWTCSTWST